MEAQKFTLTFDDTTLADANNYASELKEKLEGAEGVEIERGHLSENTQDFGATLILILGTSAVTALAKGIANWLSMRPAAKITVRSANGEVIAEGLKSSDAVKIAEAFRSILPATDSAADGGK